MIDFILGEWLVVLRFGLVHLVYFVAVENGFRNEAAVIVAARGDGEIDALQNDVIAGSGLAAVFAAAVNGQKSWDSAIGDLVRVLLNAQLLKLDKF